MESACPAMSGFLVAKSCKELHGLQTEKQPVATFALVILVVLIIFNTNRLSK